jgi:hypothetical protein
MHYVSVHYNQVDQFMMLEPVAVVHRIVLILYLFASGDIN